jgi:hypothetical protein
MNAYHYLLLAWFALGAVCVIFSLRHIRTHENQLTNEIPAAQVLGCIPPPFKWAVIVIMLFFGPLVLLWAVYAAIQDLRKGTNETLPSRPPAAATEFSPQTAWVVLFALVGACVAAYAWASACPEKSLPTFMMDQARTIGSMLFIFVLPGVLAGRNPFSDLRSFGLVWVPLYLVEMVRAVASMTVGWEGGWLLGMVGAAAGAGAGAVMGWMFNRWTLPDLARIQREPAPSRRLPLAFAGLFALFGGYLWGVEWVTPKDAWIIGMAWILLALPGALVGRPVLGLLVMSPFVVVMLVPLLASITVGWEGGWTLGIAGAVVGAAAGAVKGRLFNRWIMPEYDKRRARASALRPRGSTERPGSNESTAERS